MTFLLKSKPVVTFLVRVMLDIPGPARPWPTSSRTLRSLLLHPYPRFLLSPGEPKPGQDLLLLGQYLLFPLESLEHTVVSSSEILFS